MVVEVDESGEDEVVGFEDTGIVGIERLLGDMEDDAVLNLKPVVGEDAIRSDDIAANE